MKKKIGLLVMAMGFVAFTTMSFMSTDPVRSGEKNAEEQLCILPAPAKFKCDNNKTGMVLAWQAVSGASGYQIELNFMAPCCGTIGQPYFATFNVPSTYFQVPSTMQQCFSWRVRSLCSDGTPGPWSSSNCSCQ